MLGNYTSFSFGTICLALVGPQGRGDIDEAFQHVAAENHREGGMMMRVSNMLQQNDHRESGTMMRASNILLQRDHITKYSEESVMGVL